MRSVFFVSAFIVGVLLIAGSSGTFGGYNSTRDASFWVVSPDLGYLGFDCSGGYSALVFLQANSEADFDAINITNSLPGNRDADVALSPDYSWLPTGFSVSVETDDGNPVTLYPGEVYAFEGHVSVGDVEPGEYTVPLEVHATWDDGGASLSVCPIKLVVTGPPTMPTIEKVLLSGNTSGIPLKSRQEWVFQIIVTNPTLRDVSITVVDAIPAEFNVSPSGTAASAGNYTFWPAGGHGRHCGCSNGSATKMEWNVTLPAGGSERMNVTIFTRLNHGNQREFTSCGNYSLNDGAVILGYGIVSNGIRVSTACGGNGP